ncbi:PREDICTED: homeobox protein SIX3-like [Rhagoletis zephyria]|uniref:homeobox protein SIX3-like n=1 Tax=Rhagoletis zephyria TaxID=28612 RepID=UPI000811402E|nr:PREDICTED: homeobox protein SIX3-like [Rhagoletis zephyria]
MSSRPEPKWELQAQLTSQLECFTMADSLVKTYLLGSPHKDRLMAHLKELVALMSVSPLLNRCHLSLNYYQVLIARHEKDHGKVKELIRSLTFKPETWEHLRTVWYDTLHEEEDRPLSEVQRHRLHKKQPWPPSIAGEMKDVKYGRDENSRTILNSFYARNPSPNTGEKESLAKAIPGFTVRDVATWFKNRRHRDPAKPSGNAIQKKKLPQPKAGCSKNSKTDKKSDSGSEPDDMEIDERSLTIID